MTRSEFYPKIPHPKGRITLPPPLQNLQDQPPEASLEPKSASATPITKPKRSMSRADQPASIKLVMALALPTLIEQLFSAVSAPATQAQPQCPLC